MELDGSADEARGIATVVDPIIINVSKNDTSHEGSSHGDQKSPLASCLHSSPDRNNAPLTEPK